MALKKRDIARPVLPAEAVDVPELGGEVIVRGMMLSQRLELITKLRDSRLQTAHILAMCVVDADSEPVYTVDEWEAFGAKHFEASLRIADVALRLSGFDKADAGKS